MTQLSYEEHRQRHLELHRALDELYADYLAHKLTVQSIHDGDFFPVTINQLMEWSFEQTKHPDELIESKP